MSSAPAPASNAGPRRRNRRPRPAASSPPPTAAQPSQRARAKPAASRYGRNDVNIDGRTQQLIWQQLKTFQDDPTATALPFPASLSTQDRKYVHKMAANLNFTTKSTGNKNDGSRHVVVYKRADGGDGHRRDRDRDRDAVDDLLPLPPAIRALVDRFLVSHPLEQIADFNPLHMTTQPALNPHNNSHTAQQRRPTRSVPVPPAAAAASTPRYRAMLGGRERLPIWKQRDAILQLYEQNQVTVISGATGCGKSTQVPQFILDHLHTVPSYQPLSCDIICTQPRRISAIALAERVAAERGEDIGQSVGYQIRLERCASSSTRILFCTVGILLRRLATDPTLSSVSTLIIDECHERERNCDFLLTCLRDLLPSRPTLKLVLMSATISEQLFVQYFKASHIFCEGFTWPVQVFWLADVVELSGWQEGRGGAAGSSRGRTGDGRKEAEMRKRLHELVERRLYESEKEGGKMEEQDVLRRLNDDSKEAILHDEAIAILEKRSAEKNKPIGWTDTWVFKPDYDTADLSGAGNASGSEAQLHALLQSVNAAGTVPSATSTMSASALAEKAQHQERMQHVVVEHSDSTLATVKRLEEEGMDYIDYGLVVAAILYICTSFASNHPSQHQLHNNNDTNNRSRSADYEVDVDNGAILVFLPGWEDINRLLSDLRSHPHFASNASHYSILPLHGSIPSTEQRRIFAKPVAGVRKIVLSTNIAETSITIDDVVFVLDCGKMKEKTYDPYTNMSSLASTWVSQANAKQRAGRAGRSRPGVCFRLYSPIMYERMDEFQTPELLRTPLEEVCLQIKLLQLDGVEAFLSRCLQPPAAVAVRTALDLLVQLGALTEGEELTELGEYLAALPVDPRLGKMMLYGAAFQCLDPILTVASILAYRDPFVLPLEQDRRRAQEVRRQLSHGSQCDLTTMLHAFNGYQRLSATQPGRVYAYCLAEDMEVLTDRGFKSRAEVFAACPELAPPFAAAAMEPDDDLPFGGAVLSSKASPLYWTPSPADEEADKRAGIRYEYFKSKRANSAVSLRDSKGLYGRHCGVCGDRVWSVSLNGASQALGKHNCSSHSAEVAALDAARSKAEGGGAVRRGSLQLKNPSAMSDVSVEKSPAFSTTSSGVAETGSHSRTSNGVARSGTRSSNSAIRHSDRSTCSAVLPVSRVGQSVSSSSSTASSERRQGVTSESPASTTRSLLSVSTAFGSGLGSEFESTGGRSRASSLSLSSSSLSGSSAGPEDAACQVYSITKFTTKRNSPMLMLLCDGDGGQPGQQCQNGQHLRCAGLKATPADDWFCQWCRAEAPSQTYYPGRSMSPSIPIDRKMAAAQIAAINSTAAAPARFLVDSMEVDGQPSGEPAPVTFHAEMDVDEPKAERKDEQLAISAVCPSPAASSLPLLFASLDPSTGHLVYLPATALTYKTVTSLVEFTHAAEAPHWGADADEYGLTPDQVARMKAQSDRHRNGEKVAEKFHTKHTSNNVSVVVDRQHDMYVRVGMAKSVADADASMRGTLWAATDYHKVKAGSLLTDDVRQRVKMTGQAAAGIEASDDADELPFAPMLGLASEKQLTAFLELYGYWCGDGSLRVWDSSRSVSFSPKKKHDKVWVIERLKTLGLTVESGDVSCFDSANGQLAIYVTEPRWVDYFFGEYGPKYGVPSPMSAAAAVTHTGLTTYNIKSVKWFWMWVWRLRKVRARRVLAGLRYADGNEAADVSDIYTSGITFRDDIVRLALHAGYSARFTVMYKKDDHRGYDAAGKDIIAQHDGWMVSYSDHPLAAEPVLYNHRDIQRLDEPNGAPVWCVTVPPHNLVITRRVTKNAKDAVTSASRPVVIGNCKEHFLHLSGMAMIADMKEQFFAILREAGLLDENEAGGRERLVDYYNVNSGAAELIHAVIVSALYPNAAKVRFIGKGPGGSKGRKRAVLSTRDALSGLRIHPSSVLDERELRPIPVDGEVEVELDDDDDDNGEAEDNDEDDEHETGAGVQQLVASGKQRGVAPWVMYYEVTRSTQVFLRAASFASPWLLCFMASAAEQQHEQDSKQPQQPEEEKKAQSSSSEDEEEDDDEDGEEEAEEENEVDEVAVDDEGGDIIVLNRNGTAQPPAATPVASQPSKFVKFKLSSFIQYSMWREDAARMHAVRRFIHWLLHQRILRSHISLPLHQTDRGRQRTSQQPSQHEQLERDVIALLTELLNEDASFSRGGGAGTEGEQAPSTYVQRAVRGMRGTRGGFDGSRGGHGMPGRGAPMGRGRGGYVSSAVNSAAQTAYPIPGVAGRLPAAAPGQSALQWLQQSAASSLTPAPSHMPQYSTIRFIQPQPSQPAVATGSHRPYYAPDQAWRAAGYDPSVPHVNSAHAHAPASGSIGEQTMLQPHGGRGGRGWGRGGQVGRGRGRGGRGGGNGLYQQVVQEGEGGRGGRGGRGGSSGGMREQ